jgi:tRNA (mo5U34)-methyltransferase
MRSSSATACGVQEPPFALSASEARAFVASFPFWYHNIYLGNGVYTMSGRGYHEDVWAKFRKVIPQSLGGYSVLDVGTNAGYFALQAKLLGAQPVVGTEFVDLFIEQAKAVSKIWGVEIDYQKMDVHDVLKLRQTFDIVILAGILYHLKNPLQVIQDIGKICNDAILVESEIIPDDPHNCVMVRQGKPPTLQPVHKGMMKFIETTELNEDSSNWWVPDTECVMGMLRSAGFEFFSQRVTLSEFRLCLVASKKRDSVLNLSAFGS